MRIRTQLILASFILAVVPLAAIVTYSYRSSRRALEAADRRETGRMTQQMDRRLASIRADLDQRISLVSALPVADAGTGDIDANIAAAMGDATNIVESLEFKPITPERPERPEVPEKTEPKENPEQKEKQEKVVIVHAGHPNAPAVAGVELPDLPGTPGTPVVIDLPSAPVMPQYRMNEEQQELLSEIGRLGTQLGDQSLSPDDRADVRHELAALQKQLHDVIAADTRRYRAQMRNAQHLAPEAIAPPAPVAAPAPRIAVAPRVKARDLTALELEKVRTAERKAALILGRRFKAPVRKQGEVVGQLTPAINADRVIRRVLGAAEDREEIPFAIDREGTVYTRTPEDRATLARVGISQRVRSGASVHGIPGWIVSTSVDNQSGLRIGVARPVGANLEELRRTAARNFGLGLGLIAFALIGIVPFSNHLTRDVKLVTDGAERIAQGDLLTRLPVKTDNELGQLARAFNQMAEDLSLQQEKLLAQERAQKEQEISQRVLAVEYERKSVELEDARRFQLSMLPKEVPHHKSYEIAVYTRTATEVGGDYYDFHVASDGTLSITIGDAIGHGAKAGTMVTVIKTLFSGYDGATTPAGFLRDAAEKIKRMELGRMSMALSLGRFDGHQLTLASAGMPPVLVHRAASAAVEEIALAATPLGTLGSEYPETTCELAPGDTVLFLSDGFPELMNDAGQQFGYTAALDAFTAAAGGRNAAEVIAALAAVAERWHGDAPPNDDVTFVVARVS
jgi:serine phosphatase RsbU (regulator of sigma subunit)